MGSDVGGDSARPDTLTVLRSGGRESLDQLVPLVYDELRRIAHLHVARHRNDAEGAPTVATTALVHEVYLKLVDQTQATWHDRSHFLAIASVAMRHVLIDRAKARAALKRGGARERVTLDDHVAESDDDPAALLEIDDALRHLGETSPRLARVVECRFFGGLTDGETAEALGVTVRTVQRDWTKARMLLERALGASSAT